MMFNMPSPEELNKMWEADRKRGEAARMMADDSDPVSAGNFYTVTRSFDRGDGSWCEDFWEVLSVNGPKAFVRIHCRSGPVERFWTISNRSWYLANDAWEISQKAKQTTD